jgi:hypothetical protein
MVFFVGNAPTLGAYVFDSDSKATVYYLAGTTVWGSAFGGLPTLLIPFYCTDNGDGTCAITGYNGSGGAVTIPNTLAGLLVTSIGSNAFYSCTSLTDVTIPNSVTNIGMQAFKFCINLSDITIPNNIISIGDSAFQACASLASVYFPSVAPSLGTNVFKSDNNATIYYMPGATNWGSFTGPAPVLWNPQAVHDVNFGIHANRFGFTITNAGNPTIVVDACTNLANPVWVPVSTNMLSGGSSYFSDAQWTNYPGRFYRFRAP